MLKVLMNRNGESPEPGASFSGDVLCVVGTPMRAILRDRHGVGFWVEGESDSIHHRDADLWITSSIAARAGSNVVIDNLTDTGHLYPDIRNHLVNRSRPVVKRCRYDWPLYRKPVHGRCYHARFLQQYHFHGVTPGASLDCRSLGFTPDLHLWPGYAYWPRLNYLKSGHDLRVNGDRRPYDVSFAGTTTYAWPEIAGHRKACVLAIQSLDDLGVSYHVSNSRSKTEMEYWSMLHRTKIAVSPWGFGAMCHRDFEAILAGCVVVKPSTSWLRAVPDVYNRPGMFVTCLPDFSDLGEVVSSILDGYPSYFNQALNNREWLLGESTPEKAAQQLSATFHQLVERVSTV